MADWYFVMGPGIIHRMLSLKSEAGWFNLMSRLKKYLTAVSLTSLDVIHQVSDQILQQQMNWHKQHMVRTVSDQHQWCPCVYIQKILCGATGNPNARPCKYNIVKQTKSRGFSSLRELQNIRSPIFSYYGVKTNTESNMRGTHFWNLQSDKLSQLSPGPEGFLVSIALRGYHDAYKQNKNRGQI